jgi:hypothetical protein
MRPHVPWASEAIDRVGEQRATVKMVNGDDARH